MKRIGISSIAITLGLTFSGYVNAQAIEAIYNLNFDSTSDTAAALEALFADKDLRGNKATFYEADFGTRGEASHVIVVDYDSYADRDKFDQNRRESHGWSKYVLATQDAEFVSAELGVVRRDFGKPRHEAGYLVVILMQVKDSGAYLEAITALHEAEDNPGVLRLVELRSGPSTVTHAVLVGADDFASANAYLDELTASDAFAEFSAKVEGNRHIVAVHMYRRVGAYGY